MLEQLLKCNETQYSDTESIVNNPICPITLKLRGLGNRSHLWTVLIFLKRTLFKDMGNFSNFKLKLNHMIFLNNDL